MATIVRRPTMRGLAAVLVAIAIPVGVMILDAGVATASPDYEICDEIARLAVGTSASDAEFNTWVQFGHQNGCW